MSTKKTRLCYTCAKSPATLPGDLDRYLCSRVMDKVAPCDRCGSGDYTKTFRPTSRQEPDATLVATSAIPEAVRDASLPPT